MLLTIRKVSVFHGRSELGGDWKALNMLTSSNIDIRGLTAYFMLPRAISMAFWRLGSPVGSNLCLSAMDLSTSGGFPIPRRKKRKSQTQVLPPLYTKHRSQFT